MRRVILALAATALGLTLLLAYKATGTPRHHRVALAPLSRPTGSPTPAASGTPKATAAAGRRSLTGQPMDTPYGPVQVRVTLSGTRLVDVRAVQLPSGSDRDAEINGYAVPMLRQEARGAQSAQIDVVSGATFTSNGYAQSLQSALDQAGR